ncbi:MAG: COR domain-containing protein [Planctomycetota bacterium]
MGIPLELKFDAPSQLLDYYFSIQQQNKMLGEAKLLLVGQGEVGKTSIANRLMSDHFNPNEGKTNGIEIHQWMVGERDGAQLRLNVWDFGGQEIMHATHQFFLTKRSVYLLVVAARAGERDGNLHYWLEMIGLYGGDSPVILVMNKCEETYRDFDENRIRIDYGNRINICGFHYTSCKTGEGFFELSKQIVNNASSLSHVQDLLPINYFSIKSTLEEEASISDIISEDQYIEICKLNKVTDRSEQMRLLRFLHDLGCVLHYDDPDQNFALRDTRILNPEWITSGVYQILNNPDFLRKGDGLISKSELSSVFADDECNSGKSRNDFLVEIMAMYELCFAFPNNTNMLLVPELLSSKEPDIGWGKPGDLPRSTVNFRYHYAVLPHGMIPRLIVRCNHLLTTSPTYWKSGVVLEVEGCRALVRGDHRQGVVHIQIQGENKSRRREALAVIRNNFSAVHQTYGDLRVEAKVPLPRHPLAPPVDYEFLLELERNNTITHHFEKASVYSVSRLLDGVDVRRYDLFMCYNNEDKDAVAGLVARMKQRGIRCWIDDADLTPGREWIVEVGDAITECSAMAIVMGPNGIGKWQSQEIQVALNQKLEGKDMAIIPVLIPGGSLRSLPSKIEFLRTMSIVNFEHGFDIIYSSLHETGDDATSDQIKTSKQMDEMASKIQLEWDKLLRAIEVK